MLKCSGLRGAKVCKSCRSWRELSHEYLLAKIGFDTAENEPLKGSEVTPFIYPLSPPVKAPLAAGAERLPRRAPPDERRARLPALGGARLGLF